MASHRKLPRGSGICRMDPSCFPRVHGWSGHRNSVGATIKSEILPKYAKPVPNISPRKIPFLTQISRTFLRQICIPVRGQISQQKDYWHVGGTVHSGCMRHPRPPLTRSRPAALTTRPIHRHLDLQGGEPKNGGEPRNCA